jgi:hypothetical protein
MRNTQPLLQFRRLINQTISWKISRKRETTQPSSGRKGSQQFNTGNIAAECRRFFFQTSGRV